MLKVLYVCNFEAPYRIDFWNQLSHLCDLTVVFTESIEQQMKSQNRDRRWFKKREYEFESELLKQTKIGRLLLCLGVKDYLRKDYDIVIFHPYSPPSCVYGILYCITHKIPYMINSDGGFHKSGKGLKEKLKGFIISNAEGILSTGGATDYYLQFYGAKRERLYRYTLTSLYKESIRSCLYSKEEIDRYKKELGIQEDKVIISVGRIIPIKGYATLVRAASLIDSNIGIYIIGGEETDELKHIRIALNVSNIHYVKFVNSDEIYKYYAAANVFVMTTKGDVWGLVINEALANGVPVISTYSCIAATELVKDGYNGYFFNAGDYKELAKLLNKYFDIDDGKSIMKKNALSSIKNVTIENMAIRHLDIFQEVLNKR